MPRRGSREGAWTEKAEWVWSFGKEGVAVDYKIDQGKQLESGRVTYDPQRKVYRLAGKFADETSRQYTGKLDENKLLFESPPDEDGYVHLLTISSVNEKRSLVLYQKRREESKFLARVAEVGYTRAGTSLAVEGAGEIECIVTGGKGTTPVTYKGETYYVCCSGCKLAFDDDPEGVIAEYKQKVAERKKAQNSD
jgi:YHS domain-containing protein